MQWSRVKSILIVLLLLVDGFLGCMLGVKAFSAYQQAQTTRAQLDTVLAGYGLTLDETMSLPDEALMPQLNIDRNRADEAAVATALLGGEAERSEEEAGSRFTSPVGTVVWSEDGTLEAVLQPAGYVRPTADEVRAQAAALLQDAGIQTAGADWETHVWTARAHFKTAGYAVFNRALTVTFSEEAVRIEGLWTFDTPYATRSDLYATYNPVDALLQFARQGLASKVVDMEPGLLLGNTAGNQFQLSPVWKITADTGVYYADPIKNEITAAEEE